MATVTHTIHSHYDPADREKLERETGQRTDDTFDPWQTESSAQRRIRAAPTFVSATISYDEWGTQSRTSLPPAVPEKPGQTFSSTAEWYKSLTSSSSRTGGPPRPLSAPAPGPRFHVKDGRQAQTRRTESATKDWFISEALRSEPSTKPSSPSPSLADLLARDPPPLPSEGRYTPTVWLHIGPSNRGFGMLQRSGWSEGEGLGAHVRRVARMDERASTSIKAEDDVTGVQNVPEVVGLALSDSEASEDDDIQVLGHNQAYTGEASAAHMQTSLLTPLPTVLKADRLGIGLKAKTDGPYKRSRKRVTHNAAALAAHIRSAEEMRRTKTLVGRGKRGFAKMHKREEDRRKAMLAYLNE